MTMADLIGSLSDRSVVLSIQELAEDIGCTDPAHTPLDSDEAQLLVSTLLKADTEATGMREIAAMPEGQCIDAARRLLAYLAKDPDTAAQTRAVLSDPPTDEQMSVQTAITSAAVLGALIAWLQTKIDIKITRKNGKSEFEFRLIKNSTPANVLRDLAATVTHLLKGPPQ